MRPSPACLADSSMERGSSNWRRSPTRLLHRPRSGLRCWALSLAEARSLAEFARARHRRDTSCSCSTIVDHLHRRGSCPGEAIIRPVPRATYCDQPRDLRMGEAWLPGTTARRPAPGHEARTSSSATRLLWSCSSPGQGTGRVLIAAAEISVDCRSICRPSTALSAPPSNCAPPQAAFRRD